MAERREPHPGPVEPGQTWWAPDEDGLAPFRRIRVLAAHPDGGWIIEDLPSKMLPHPHGMTRCADWNLRYVFRPEAEVLPSGNESRRIVIDLGLRLVALSPACHTGRHGDCQHHQPGKQHGCECACHLR